MSLFHKFVYIYIFLNLSVNQYLCHNLGYTQKIQAIHIPQIVIDDSLFVLCAVCIL